MLIFNNNEWSEITDSLSTNFYNFVQILLTWKGEQDFDTTNGVDWYNVLNGSVDLRVEINTISTLFSDIFNVEILEYNKYDTSINITLFVSFYDVLQTKEIVITTEGSSINAIY